MSQPISVTSEATVTAIPKATWRDYVTLTKPKVISLLLLTTVGRDVHCR